VYILFISCISGYIDVSLYLSCISVSLPCTSVYLIIHSCISVNVVNICKYLEFFCDSLQLVVWGD
jgi:hypothetical protein